MNEFKLYLTLPYLTLRTDQVNQDLSVCAVCPEIWEWLQLKELFTLLLKQFLWDRRCVAGTGRLATERALLDENSHDNMRHNGVDLIPEL